MACDEGGGPSVEAAGPVNLRDVGGLPVESGGRTRCGVLYRGDAFYAGDDHPGSMGVWPPAVVVDLRGHRERLPSLFTWAQEVDAISFPLHDRAVPNSLPPDADMASLYRAILDQAADRVAQAATIVMTRPGPALVHCTVGKDRTGVVVAVLLRLAGVRRDAIVRDYCATARVVASMQPRWVRFGVRAADAPPLPEQVLSSPAEAIEVVLDELDSHPDGPVGWALQHGVARDDIDAWRARFVTDPCT